MLMKYFNARPMLIVFGVFIGVTIAIGTALITPYYNQALAENHATTNNNSSAVSIRLIGEWGSLGNEPTQFAPGNSTAGNHPACEDNQISESNLTIGCLPNPRGIAVDDSDNVYVADTLGRHIKKVESFNGLRIIRVMGLAGGHGNYQFSLPWDIAAYDSVRWPYVSHIYIADHRNHQVAEFTVPISSNGTFVRKWGGFSTDSNGNGTFDSPTAIAVDPIYHFVYVGDAYKHIQKFDSNGTFITKFGGPGQANGTFYENVGGIAVARDGTIYATDPFMDRVQKFNSNGKFITKWGSPGKGDGQFGCGKPPSFANCYDLGPQGIAVDSLGHVYVVDTINNRIEVFNTNGTFITKWGSQGSGDGQFNGPTAIAIPRDTTVYVSDSGNHRIQHFAINGWLVNANGTPRWERQPSILQTRLSQH
jgi:tripartite motif-containing protein 71